MASGWIGTARQFDYTVRTFGAEVDEEDRVLVAGELPTSFMGLGEELVVTETVKVRIKGQWVSALGLLQATSYGLKINVL